MADEKFKLGGREYPQGMVFWTVGEDGRARVSQMFQEYMQANDHDPKDLLRCHIESKTDEDAIVDAPLRA